MFPYLLLIGLSFVFSYVAITETTKNTKTYRHRTLAIGNSAYVKKNNISLFVFFLVYFFLLALRDIEIGRDLEKYKYYFNYYRNLSFASLFEVEGDILYNFLNWAIGSFTDNFLVFQVIISALTIVPLYKVYSEDKTHSFLKVILFMNMPIFILIFSGLRQSLAIAIGMIAYKWVKEKRPLLFLFTVAIAIGVHHSAFMLLFMYPIYNIRLKKIALLFIVPLTVGLFIFNEPVFLFLTAIAYRLSGGMYEAEMSSTGAYTTIILLILFTIMAYVIPDENEMDEETFGLRNFLLFALWMQCFAPLHNLAMRLNYYYIIFVPMIIPKILECSRHRYRKVATLAEVVIGGYLLYYYLSNTYQACITGISGLDTYPYVPFWGN